MEEKTGDNMIEIDEFNVAVKKLIANLNESIENIKKFRKELKD